MNGTLIVQFILLLILYNFTTYLIFTIWRHKDKMDVRLRSPLMTTIIAVTYASLTTAVFVYQDGPNPQNVFHFHLSIGGTNAGMIAVFLQLLRQVCLLDAGIRKYCGAILMDNKAGFILFIAMSISITGVEFQRRKASQCDTTDLSCIYGFITFGYGIINFLVIGNVFALLRRLGIKTSANVSNASPDNVVSWGTRSNLQRSSLVIRNNSVGFVGELADVTGSTAINNGAWHHIACTYDGTTIRLYIDGSLETSGNVTLNTTDQNLVIGKVAEPDNEEYFDGQIDEVRIWNVALSTTEIGDIYNQSFTNPTDPSCLVAYYKMNEGAGPTVNDLTGNGNTGTLTNMESGDWVTSTAGVTDQAVSSATITSCAVLPVELVDFTAKHIHEGIQLEWLTASETDNQAFEIEYSTEGRSFETIGIVDGNGTTVERQNYNFTHYTPSSGMNYYRLKQIDFDGAFEYSEVLSVTIQELEHSVVSIFPNPVVSTLNIANGEGLATIFNMLGQPVKEFVILNAQHAIDIQALPKGQYILRIQQQNENRIIQRFIKQ